MVICLLAFTKKLVHHESCGEPKWEWSDISHFCWNCLRLMFKCYRFSWTWIFHIFLQFEKFVDGPFYWFNWLRSGLPELKGPNTKAKDLIRVHFSKIRDHLVGRNDTPSTQTKLDSWEALAAPDNECLKALKSSSQTLQSHIKTWKALWDASIINRRFKSQCNFETCTRNKDRNASSTHSWAKPIKFYQFRQRCLRAPWGGCRLILVH